MTDSSKRVVLRCYALWRCVDAWNVLRSADHTSFSFVDCTNDQEALVGKAAKTNTTGQDKKSAVKGSFPQHGSADVGTEMVAGRVESVAARRSMEKDFFLLAPSKEFCHWDRFECKYAEAVVLSQTPEYNFEVPLTSK